jgi:hypothetical protein
VPARPASEAVDEYGLPMVPQSRQVVIAIVFYRYWMKP